MSNAGKLIAAGMIVLTSPIGSAMGCSIADVEIGQAEIIVENRATTVVGELTNRCSDATGVRIRITLRDDEGTVLLTGDFWPAGGRNIPARDRRGFTYVVSPADRNPSRRATALTVEVSAVRTW